MITLRQGRWQDVLKETSCDALISDPPYGARTHEGQTYECERKNNDAHVSEQGLGYDALTPEQVHELVEHWEPRTRGWMCFFTSHDLVPVYTEALQAKRYVFAPIACVQRGMNVRLAGDGPANWTTWLVVARGRSLKNWGALPGAYTGSTGRDKAFERVPGSKPLWLMRAVIRDYSRHSDVICDPYAGAGTTLLAARAEGRHAVGAEMDQQRYELAQRNLFPQSNTLSLFGEEAP